MSILCHFSTASTASRFFRDLNLSLLSGRCINQHRLNQISSQKSLSFVYYKNQIGKKISIKFTCLTEITMVTSPTFTGVRVDSIHTRSMDTRVAGTFVYFCNVKDNCLLYLYRVRPLKHTEPIFRYFLYIVIRTVYRQKCRLPNNF